MSWFSIKGIKEEIRKIQWPKRKELSKNTVIVLSFVLFFAVYFVIADGLVSQFLRLIGVL